MRLFRSLTNGELREALAHVHLLVHVHLAETDRDEVGPTFQDPLRGTVNRFLDSLPFEEPEGECWVEGRTGVAPVVGAMITPEGVTLLLDRSRARPVTAPKSP